jgi:hypothetical protein
LIEAFFVHALWLISAVIMAMSFWVTWRAWRFDRIRAIGELVHRPDFKADDLNSLDSRLLARKDDEPWRAKKEPLESG